MEQRYPVEAATVTLHLRDGRRLARHVQAARGSLASPLTDADIEQKLRTLCAWGGSGCAPEPLIDALWTLDQRDDAGSLMALAAAPH